MASLFIDSDVMLGLRLLVLVDVDEDFNNLIVNREIFVPRNGIWIINKYLSARSHFTTAFSNWSLSCQNDPEKFIEFIVDSPYSRKPSTLGWCVLVLFHGMKCGTPQDEEMFNFTIRLVTNDEGYDDGNYCSDANPRTRKRHIVMNDVIEIARQRSKAFAKLTSVIKSTLPHLPWSIDSHNNCEKEPHIDRLRTRTVQRAELLSLKIQYDVTKASLDIITTELESLQSKISRYK